jgi:hypothetical protein
MFMNVFYISPEAFKVNTSGNQLHRSVELIQNAGLLFLCVWLLENYFATEVSFCKCNVGMQFVNWQQYTTLFRGYMIRIAATMLAILVEVWLGCTEYFLMSRGYDGTGPTMFIYSHDLAFHFIRWYKVCTAERIPLDTRKYMLNIKRYDKAISFLLFFDLFIHLYFTIKAKIWKVFTIK